VLLGLADQPADLDGLLSVVGSGSSYRRSTTASARRFYTLDQTREERGTATSDRSCWLSQLLANQGFPVISSFPSYVDPKGNPLLAAARVALIKTVAPRSGGDGVLTGTTAFKSPWGT